MFRVQSHVVASSSWGTDAHLRQVRRTGAGTPVADVMRPDSRSCRFPVVWSEGLRYTVYRSFSATVKFYNDVTIGACKHVGWLITRGRRDRMKSSTSTIMEVEPKRCGTHHITCVIPVNKANSS
jgi:hypothetical protein